MTLATFLLTAGALVAPAQDPASAADAWEPIDGVAAVAGDEVVTLAHLRNFVEQRMRQFDIGLTTQAEYDDALAKSLAPSITQHLEAQAGRDLGLDAERIRGAIRSNLQERRKDLGPTEYREFLERQGLDALTAGLNQVDALYRSAWRGYILGNRGGPNERPVKDRFVRPGELRAIYIASRDQLGDPDKIRFQDLVIPVDAAGGIIEARALATDVRQQALDGEDFDFLVEEFSVSSPETLGVTELLVVPRISDPAALAFAQRAAVGDYSEVMPILRQETVVAFRVLKLHSRAEGTPVPRFGEPGVQDRLRRRFLFKRDERLLDRARSNLHERAYVWQSPEYEVVEQAALDIPPSLRRP